MRFLTNEERRCLALSLVSPAGHREKLKPSPYDDHDTFAYIDKTENKIKKVIQLSRESKKAYYEEYDVDETLTEDGKEILPKTEKGKNVKLSSATISKKTRIGMSIYYVKECICLFHHTTKQDYYISEYDEYPITDFDAWLKKWCSETGEKELQELQAFAVRKPIHVAYREGDFFRFRIKRNLYGYGRILVNYAEMRKKKIPFWDIFMGKPLLVGVYHIVTEREDISPEELEKRMMLPTQLIMDNHFYYGTCEIIGNLPVDEGAADYTVHYGKSFQLRDHTLCYQCGKTFLTIPEGKYLFEGQDLFGFSNGAIGFYLHVKRPILEACIRESSNLPYWNQPNFLLLKADIRHPEHTEALRLVKKQFHISD